MVDDKLFDEILYLSVIICESTALFGCKYYIFNGFHFCRRSGQAYLCGIGIYICRTPLL